MNLPNGIDLPTWRKALENTGLWPPYVGITEPWQDRIPHPAKE